MRVLPSGREGKGKNDRNRHLKDVVVNYDVGVADEALHFRLFDFEVNHPRVQIDMKNGPLGLNHRIVLVALTNDPVFEC